MAANQNHRQGQPIARDALVTLKIDTDALLKAATVSRPREGQPQHAYTPHQPQGQDTHIEKTASQTTRRRQFQPGDASVLGGQEPETGSGMGVPDMGFVSQVLSGTQHKVAAAQREFWSFVLPDGHLLTPRLREQLVKQALAIAPSQPGQTMPVQQAEQAMQQFMPQKPLLAGQGPMQTGLDGPSDTRAAAMPGTPGHAATNVIDQRGGLDPRGMTVDGNNAAGVAKGFKMAQSSEGSDAAAWDERLRKLWERRDPDGIEAANPFRQEKAAFADLPQRLHQLRQDRGDAAFNRDHSQGMLPDPDWEQLLAAVTGTEKAAMDDCYAYACKTADNEWGCTCKGECPACARSLRSKAAAVEPLPRWKNPPRKPLNQEMLESPGVQNLLAALGMESTPDGDVRDKHACESSHSHGSQAEALFAASELSQLLKST